MDMTRTSVAMETGKGVQEPRKFNCRLCGGKHLSFNECPCCCGECGGELDSQGNCRSYCLEGSVS